MGRWLTGVLGHAAGAGLREVGASLVAAMMVALFAAISLGFGTFAAYGYLANGLGGGLAALILSAAYGLVAVGIWAVWAMRHRQAERLRCAAAAPQTWLGPATAILESLAETAPAEDRALIATLTRLGRDLTPMQLIALAVTSGFIVGRKRDK